MITESLVNSKASEFMGWVKYHSSLKIAVLIGYFLVLMNSDGKKMLDCLQMDILVTNWVKCRGILADCQLVQVGMLTILK